MSLLTKEEKEEGILHVKLDIQCQRVALLAREMQAAASESRIPENIDPMIAGMEKLLADQKFRNRT
jgi:hypothetical protein